MNGKTTSHAPAAASGSKRSRDDTDLLATRCTLVAVMRGFIVFLFVLPVIFISWGLVDSISWVPLLQVLQEFFMLSLFQCMCRLMKRCNPERREESRGVGECQPQDQS